MFLYKPLAAAACAAMVLLPCLAQTPVSFNSVTTKSGPMPSDIYAVDVNNDGIPDLIGDAIQGSTTCDPQNPNDCYSQTPSGFTVSIGVGDGTFRAPVAYKVSNTSTPPPPMAFGDFNGDGKVDIAVAIPGANTVAVYLGNSDGTFQVPRDSTIALPSGQVFASAPIVTADFNGDGKLDLIAVGAVPSTTTATPAVYAIEGDGSGGFGAAQAIYTAPAGTAIGYIALGDFDGDGNADVALTYTTARLGEGITSTVMHVLFGDGNLGFTDTTVFHASGFVDLSSGDLNGDGRTDLFAIDAPDNRLATFYGQTDRTFNSYFSSLPSGAFGAGPSGWEAPLAMANFNDDGYMDLVVFNFTVARSGVSNNLAFFLGSKNPGQFTTQLVPLPDYSFASNPVAGNFNGNNKPGVVIALSNQYSGSTNNSPSYVWAGINSTSHGIWSDCAYPMKGQGISLCAPTASTTSPMNFNAAANSYGQPREMELWVDGKKIADQYNAWGNKAWMNFNTDFTAGPHAATLYATNVDNTRQRLNFNFTVGPSGCPPPSSSGVNVCAPAQGSTTASPLLVQATAKVPGTFFDIEVWADGTKKYTEFNGPNLNASISLDPGTHSLTVVAENGDGSKWSQTVSVKVK